MEIFRKKFMWLSRKGMLWRTKSTKFTSWPNCSTGYVMLEEHGTSHRIRAWRITVALKSVPRSRPCTRGAAERSYLLVVGVYVDDDDLIVTRTSAREIEINSSCRRWKSWRWVILDCRPTIWALKWSTREGSMHHTSYAKKILQLGGMSECNSAKCPMEPNLKLGNRVQAYYWEFEVTTYQSLMHQPVNSKD